MAISAGSVGHGVSAAITSAGTTLTKAPLSTIEPEKVLVMTIATRENVEVSTVTDTGGNVWQRISRASHSAGDAHVEVWVCRTTVQLTTSSIITATFASSVFDRQLGFREYTVASGQTLVLTPESGGLVTNELTGTNGFGSATITGLTSKQRLYYRAGAKQINVTTALTGTANFTSQGFTSRSRSNTLAIIARAEARTNTSTGETSNPTLAAAGNTIASFQALEEVDAPPWVSSIESNRIPPDSVTAVTITGYAFRAGATVTLWKSGVQVGAATNVSVNSLTEITCDFPALDRGSYDVVVENTDGQDSGTSGNSKISYKFANESVSDVLGDRLYRWYKDYTSGVWACEVGSGDADVAVSGQIPAVQNTDGGQSYPDFDGATGTWDYLEAPALSSAPVNSSAHHKAMGFLIRADSTPGGASFIYGTSAHLYYINSGGNLIIAGATSNASIIGTGWRKVIAVKSGTTGIVTLYIDGVAQTTTAANDMGSDWRTEGAYIGDRDGSGTYRFDGGLASMFFAIDTTNAFTSADISDINSALDVALNGIPNYGTITNKANGAAANGTTSLSVAYPAGIAAGDLLVLAVANKYPTNGPSTPSGWTLQAQATGGSGSSGSDSGNTYSTIFTKEATGSESGSLSVTLTGSTLSTGRMWCFSKSGGSWEMAGAIGADNSAGLDIVAEATTNPGIRRGDLMFVAFASNTDVPASYTNQAITATGVSVWGTITSYANPNTSDPFMNLATSLHPVNAGTATGVPTFTATSANQGGNAPCGGVAFLRVRASLEVSGAATIAGTSSTTANLTPYNPIYTALGSDLLALFAYNPDTTSWVPEAKRSSITCTNLVQASSDNRPTIVSTPSGNEWLEFDGTNDGMSGAVMTGLPTYNGSSGIWGFACVFQRTGTGGISQQIVDFNGNDEMIVLVAGELYAGNAFANGVIDQNVHKLIVIGTPTSPTASSIQIYIDGVLQTAVQASGAPAFGSHFAGPHGIGRQLNNSAPFLGRLGCLTWFQASSFDSTRISQLNSALGEWYEGPSGEIFATINNTSSVTATGTLIDNNFSPETRNLTIWHQDYAGSPWAGNASAGVSGTTTSSEATNPPSVGASLNSHPTADFDGTNDRLVPSISAATALGSSGWFIDTVLQLDTLHVGSEFDHPFARPGIIAADAFWGIHVSQWGFEWFQYDGGGGFNKGMISAITPTTGVWYHIQIRWDGTAISGRVTIAGNTTGSWSTPYSIASISGSLGNLRIGQNNGASARLDGRIAHIIVESGVVTDEDSDKYGSYAQGEYNLDWGFEDLGGGEEVVNGTATVAGTSTLEAALNLDLSGSAVIDGYATTTGTLIDGSGGTSDPAIVTVLGSRFKVGFFGNYSSGVWESTFAGDSLGNSNATNQPVLGTTPGGNPILTFDGADALNAEGFATNDRLNALFDFPAQANYQRLFACVFRKTGTIADTYATIFSAGSEGMSISPYSQAIRMDSNVPSYTAADSDVTVDDGEFHRLIIVSDDTNTVTSMYVDGVVQTNTIARTLFLPGIWGASHVAGLGFGLVGDFGAVTFAHTAAGETFDDIPAIDAALLEYIEGGGEPPPEGEIEATVANTSTVSATIIGTANASSTIVNTSGVNVNVNGVANIAATIIGSSEISETIIGLGLISATITNSSQVSVSGSVIAHITSVIENNSTVNAEITASGIVSSTISGVANINAEVVGIGSISSTNTNSSTVTAQIHSALSASAQIAGESSVDVSLGALGQLTATIETTSTVTAGIEGIVLRTATIIGASEVTATGSAINGLSVSASGSSTFNADISATLAVDITIAGESALNATIVSSTELSATIDGTSAISISGQATGRLSTTIANTSTVNANIFGLLPGFSTINNTSAVSASLIATGSLSTTAVNTSEVEAQAFGMGTLALTVNGTSELEATFDEIEYTAIVSGTSTVVATLQALTTSVTQISGISAVQGQITGVVRGSSIIAGTSEVNVSPNADVFLSGTSSVSAQIRGTGALQSTITNAGNLTGNISGVVQRTAIINGSSVVQASIIGLVSSTIRVDNTSTVSVELRGTGTAASNIAGTSSTTFSINSSALLQSTILGSSTIAAQVIGVVPANAVIDGTSTCEVEATAVGSLNTTISNNASINAVISATANAAVQIEGTSTHSFTVNGRGLIQSIIIGNAITNGQVAGLATGIITIAGVASSISDIEGYLTASAEINGFGDISVGIYALQAVIESSSSVRGSIFNFLQDKQIDEIDILNRSGSAFPRTLVPTKIRRVPPAPPPPPPDPPAKTPPIQKTGVRLGQQFRPGKIVKSDNSL